MTEFTLGIEAAVAGGSIALLEGDEVIRKWSSPAEISRSEELLPRIDEMLTDARIKPAQLSTIAVSNGPGSFTGLRIGIATALGLSSALGKPCIGVSTLSSMVRHSGPDDDRIAIVPIGRGGCSWLAQPPTDGELSIKDMRSGRYEDFFQRLSDYAGKVTIIAHSDAFVALSGLTAEQELPRLIDFGRDLAIHIARDSRNFDEGLEPVYPSQSIKTVNQATRDAGSRD